MELGHMDRRSQLGLAFQNSFIQTFLFLPLESLPRAFTTPPSHQPPQSRVTGNRGVPQHLEARVCLLPSWNLPPGPAPPQLFSPRHRLLSWRCRHSPRLTAARILCLPEGTQTPSPREGFMCPLVHLWSFLSHSPSLCLSSSHVPRRERFLTGSPLAPCPQPSLPLFSVLFIANSACEFGWYFMVYNLLVLPQGPSLAF